MPKIEVVLSLQNDNLNKKVDDYVPIIEMLEETKRKVEKSRDEAYEQIEELRAALDKSDKTKKRFQAEVIIIEVSLTVFIS